MFDNARRISSLNALSGTLQEESDGWFGRTRHGGRYALRGLLATARLAVRYARLKESWCRWLPGAVE